MIVLKNRFSLRIRISCARLSLEFCKDMFLDCFFNLQYVDEYITDDSMTMITLKIWNTLELISTLLLPENIVHAGMTQLTIQIAAIHKNINLPSSSCDISLDKLLLKSGQSRCKLSIQVKHMPTKLGSTEKSEKVLDGQQYTNRTHTLDNWKVKGSLQDMFLDF